MKKATAIGWAALASGALAALIVPLIVPVESTGSLTEFEAAGEEATFLELDQLSLHYESADYRGDGVDHPLFILLHGFGASTYSWREVLDDFSELGDVVAYDRPAFGLTTRPTEWEGESPYGVKAQLDLIDDVIDAFAQDSQPVVLVGHSAGGTLAAEFGLRHPDRVEGLILVAPAILQTGGGPAGLSWLYDIPQVDRIGPLLVAGIATSGEDLLERSWHDLSLLTPDIRAGYRVPLSVKGWEAAFWEFQKAPRTFTISQNPGALTVPTAIITGDDDRVVETADSLALAELIPGSKLSVLPESGHLPQEETPEEFMVEVKEALEEESLNVLPDPAPQAVMSDVVTKNLETAEAGIDCRVEACVALTFDDGPSGVVPELLDILSDYEAKATFYVVGRQVRAWPESILAITEQGHELGNHTENHVRLSKVSSSTRQSEIQELDERVWGIVGYYPQTIRPPYGDIPRSGIPDQHQRPVVMWSIDSYDWKRRPAARIVSDVLSDVAPGDIILMHALSERTVTALPDILQGLKDRELRVVTVSTLLGPGVFGPGVVKSVPYECPIEGDNQNPWCQEPVDAD